MKRILHSFYFTILLMLVFSPCIFASTTVNIVATNDMHGVLEESDTAIGVAQASAIKNSLDNSLLIDSGDATQGTTLATINKGADIIRLMNAAGYDCMVAGNHEFDYGSEQLLANANAASFPILSANALTDTGTLLPATHVIEKAGKKIGFIGITTSTTNTSTNPNLRPGVTFGNEITAAKEGIAALQGTVDTIVLLTHMGNDETVVPVTSIQLLDGLTDEELSQVSAVLDGHSHTIESEPYTRGSLSVPIIQDQTQMSHIGLVTLDFADDGNVSATENVMDYPTAMDYTLTATGEEAKEAVLNTFAQVKEEQDQITSQKIGETVTPLWGGYIYWDYAEPRIVETNFGDLVSDAFKTAAQNYAQSQGMSGEILGVVNGGGIGNSINPGTITYGDILNAFNHGNMTVVIQTTPAELYKVIENGFRTTGQTETGMLERESVSGSFIQCSGFSYSYDPAGAEGAKVASITTDAGTSLSRDDNTTPIIIGTQNYVQTFFENAELLVQLGGEDSVISDYISGMGAPVNMPTNGNRITIANDKSPETYDVAIPLYDTEDTELTTPLASQRVNMIIDNGTPESIQSDENGYLNVTLEKGPHTIQLTECDVPVYVNNYSGSGIDFTKPGYYGLSFSITPSASIPCTDIDVSTDSIDLATRYGSNTATITATVTPANTTDPITWTTSADQVASVAPAGNTATVTATAEGRAVITVSCGEMVRQITVLVSDSPIVATDFYCTSTSPDEYMVVAENVHVNRALSDAGSVEQVSMFTWSDPMQNDMNCKVIPQSEDSTNYLYTFSVNGNTVNNYYEDATHININVYASTEKGSNGSLIGALTYDYANLTSVATGLCTTAYCSNVGFVTPTVPNNSVAGTENFQEPLEGIRVGTSVADLDVIYSVNVQDIGWMPSVSNGTYAGTMHLGKPIEAIKMKLDGPSAENYNLTYQVFSLTGSPSEWFDQNEEAKIGGLGPIGGVRINLEPKN